MNEVNNYEYVDKETIGTDMALDLENILLHLDENTRLKALNQERACQLLAGFDPEDLRKEIDIDHVCKVFTDCQIIMNDMMIEQDLANV